jgi:SDR family mycofactocin-dependent oxidoreductase
MSGRVEGKVAFISGAARGQGRSHAVRLAQEGADIIAIDLCEQIPSVQYPGSTPEDLAETIREIESLDRRIVAVKADVRDFDAVKTAVDEGVAQLGRLDIVCGNAGIMLFGPETHETSARDWADTIDINLTGVWHTVKAAMPHIIAGGNGGSIVLTSSVAGVKSAPHLAPYNVAKHGVIGLMKTLALELAPRFIRVNAVLPTQVATTMIKNEAVYKLFFPEDEHPTLEQAEPVFQSLNAMPLPYVQPVDISNAVLWLASDEARYVTGVSLPIDLGSAIK